MKKDFKNIIIALLSLVLLINLIQNKTIKEENEELQNDVDFWVHEVYTRDLEIISLKSDLTQIDEEASFWYSEYKTVLNELYMLEVETGRYIEDW